MNNTIKNHSLKGTIKTTSTTASGKQAIISFAYGWDALENEAVFYDDGRLVIEGKEVASFSYRIFKMHIITEDYRNIADYARMISEAIAELETSLTSKATKS